MIEMVLYDIALELAQKVKADNKSGKEIREEYITNRGRRQLE